jgi:asparagine synthase (glutamine-hydrolysing)
MDRAFAGILRSDATRERSRDLAGPRRALGEASEVKDTALGPFALAFTGGPLRPGAGGACCLLDGHIHDLEALRVELGLDEDDPEAILAAGYARWGEELLKRLRGSFVVVLWDPHARRGIVARDQLGGRSLFLHRAGRRLLLASELRDLLHFVPSRPGPDRLAVVDWLARNKVLAGRTLHEGIDPLRPAHFLRLEEWDQGPRRYWAPRYVPAGPMSRPDVADRLRSGIQASVARHLAPDGVTGLLLSGGIDSSTIAAASLPAYASQDRSLRTYSAIFPQLGSVDESALIDTFTRALDLDGVRFSPRGGSALAGALDYLERWELPLASPNHSMWQPLLRRAAEEGVRTMMRGELGDELFGRAPYLLADLIVLGRLASAWRLTRSFPGASNRGVGSQVGLLGRYGLRPLIPARARKVARQFREPSRYVPDWLRPSIARTYLEHDNEWAWRTAAAGPRWWAHMVDQVTRNPEEVGALEYLRRLDGGAGLQSGHPFIDVDLIELVLSLPPELGFDAERNRPLLRESMAGLMPDEIRLRKGKSSFNAVVDTALSGPDLAPVRELLGSRDAEIYAYVEPGLISSQLLDRAGRYPPGEHLRNVQLWRLATAELWLRFQSDDQLPERLSARWRLPRPECEFRTVSRGEPVPA